GGHVAYLGSLTHRRARLCRSRSGRDVHVRAAALPTPGSPSPAFPRVAWTLELLSRPRRAAHSARPPQAAPGPRPAKPRPGHPAGRPPRFRGDAVVAGHGGLVVHAFGTGYRALRSPAAPCLDVPVWGGHGRGVPLPCRSDVVVAWLS